MCNSLSFIYTFTKRGLPRYKLLGCIQFSQITGVTDADGSRHRRGPETGYSIIQGKLT